MKRTRNHEPSRPLRLRLPRVGVSSMTKSNDLRVQIEEARTKLFRWMGVAFVAAAVSGAMGEGFPNTIQDYIVDVALIISMECSQDTLSD